MAVDTFQAPFPYLKVPYVTWDDNRKDDNHLKILRQHVDR